jgi:hypothetical protein
VKSLRTIDLPGLSVSLAGGWGWCCCALCSGGPACRCDACERLQILLSHPHNLTMEDCGSLLTEQCSSRPDFESNASFCDFVLKFKEDSHFLQNPVLSTLLGHRSDPPIFQCWTAAIQDVDESIPHLREENPPRKTHPMDLDRFDEGDAKVGGRKKSSLSTLGVTQFLVLALRF